MSANVIDHRGSRDGFLRLAMRGDAAISGFFGVAGLVGWIPEFSGTTKTFGYGVDSFFVVYGVIVWALAAMPVVRRAGIGVVVANLLYTAAVAVLLATHAFSLTDSGVTFAVASAVYTLTCAQLQYIGWRRIRSFR
ncbi:hypothetical protein AWC29_22855 [Mycobacterium triplex]|uniref:Integral membrane protein n=1 Tax=Mycobacterium triplex TaxID=47839 RepID=A0A024K1R2_9MYCO|nr:hypothetical protein [Mycobacterium triplex]ORX01629.1 hypothetical protein AWC29_22855 [Mycobacterium triplex]CDO89709.1 hypothetical protein BN973_04089 [Mycobacterium triplex]